MVFEIPIEDDDEEMNHISEFNFGWDSFHDGKLSQLFNKLEMKLSEANEFIREYQGLSNINEETSSKIKYMMDLVEKINLNIDETLRDWRIELASDPIGYRTHKLKLENYLNQQRDYIDKIGHFNRKMNELLAKVSTGFSRTNIDFEIIHNDDNEYINEYDVHFSRRNRIDSFNNFQLETNKDDFDQGISKYEYTKFKNQQYNMVDRQIAQETAIGINHIQSQMYEANQIFKNLASIVNEQGETIQNLETTIDSTVYTAKQAVGELRKAYNSNQQRFTQFANYGLPAFLFIILTLILALYFLHIIL